MASGWRQARKPYPDRKALKRFFDKVQIVSSGCWIWTGAACSNGSYGVFGWQGRSTSAHRYAYLWFVGSIPDGYDVDHRCYQPRCVNPAHLEAVTKQENLSRVRRVPSMWCTRGHVMTADNVFMQTNYGKAFRTCHECRRIRESRRRAKRLIAAQAEVTPGATIRTVIELERKVG